MFMQEREEIDEVFFRQPAILKHDLLVESLGTPTPPKGDPFFELKALPDCWGYEPQVPKRRSKLFKDSSRPSQGGFNDPV